MMKQKWPIFIFIFSLFLPFASVSAGTVLSSYKYAWSNNAGYINFENVTVSDSALSGYAWLVNSGWIKFDPAQGGVTNDGTGNLSGSAWGANLGWIDFNGVSINGSTGKFSGTATGALVGTITFDCSYCDVRTDWQQATTPPVVSSGGGGGGYYVSPTPVPVIPQPAITTLIPTPVPVIPQPAITKKTSLKPPKKIIPNSSLPSNDKLLLNNTNKETTQQDIGIFPQASKESVGEKINVYFKSIIYMFMSFFKNFIDGIKLLFF